MNPNENTKVINGKKIKIMVSLNEFLWYREEMFNYSFFVPLDNLPYCIQCSLFCAVCIAGATVCS